MDNTLVYLPSPSTSEFVALSKTKQGRLFRKQILPMNGEFTHPSNPKQKIKVTKEMAASMSANFDNGVCDIVQVPVVGDTNNHTENPMSNIGEVIGVDYDDTGVYVTIDARDEDAAKKLGKTLLGASALLHLDYLDTKTGNKVGPTLLHTAITNRPHITNLAGFEEVIAASADTTDESPDLYTLDSEDESEDSSTLSSQETEMTLDELKAALKADHNIDLDALQTVAASAESSEDKADDKQNELIVALSAVLSDAGATATKKDDVTLRDVADAVIQVAGERVELSAQVETLKAKSDALELSNATKEVDALVEAGKILPKQRDAMLKLSMSDRETFEALVPEDSIVALSAVGVDVHDAPKNEQLEADINRLVALASGK